MKNENALKYSFAELQQKLGECPKVNVIMCFTEEMLQDGVCGVAITLRKVNAQEGERFPIDLLGISASIYDPMFMGAEFHQMSATIDEITWGSIRKNEDNLRYFCECVYDDAGLMENGDYNDDCFVVENYHIFNYVEDWGE